MKKHAFLLGLVFLSSPADTAEVRTQSEYHLGNGVVPKSASRPRADASVAPIQSSSLGILATTKVVSEFTRTKLFQAYLQGLRQSARSEDQSKHANIQRGLKQLEMVNGLDANGLLAGLIQVTKVHEPFFGTISRRPTSLFGKLEHSSSPALFGLIAADDLSDYLSDARRLPSGAIASYQNSIIAIPVLRDRSAPSMYVVASKKQFDRLLPAERRESVERVISGISQLTGGQSAQLRLGVELGSMRSDDFTLVRYLNQR